MNLMTYLPLLGGIGLFLYGMSIMGEGLEKLAGSKLEGLLARLTSNIVKATFVGMAVTAVIQSSTATTVMVVGFVNAGIMSLQQAVGVIMGANIGTTATAWLISLADLSGTSLLFQLLKPVNLAPILVIVGAAVYLFTKKPSAKYGSLIPLGFGMLFIGINIIEEVLVPLSEVPAIQQLFLSFRNPFVGIAIGALVTAVIQSSSASMGILQAFTSTGMVTYSVAVPIIMGQNIGTCLTVLIASFGASKNAKKAAMVHLYFNLIGSVAFALGIYVLRYTVGIPIWEDLATKMGLSVFHTSFNLINTLWLLPLNSLLIKLVNMTIKKDDVGDVQPRLRILDERFLQMPTVALEQTEAVLDMMAKSSSANLRESFQLLLDYDAKRQAAVDEEETFLDDAQTAINNYLIQVTRLDLAEEENARAVAILNSLVDYERIGDHAVSICEVGRFNSENSVSFSEMARQELALLFEATELILQKTASARDSMSAYLCIQVVACEDVIGEICGMLKSRHIARLQNGTCNVQAGVSFLEVLTNIQRVAAHCTNLAEEAVRRRSGENFDAHDFKSKIRVGDRDYLSGYEECRAKYLLPIIELS